MSDFELALAHYRLLFPDLASLTGGNSTGGPDWQKEYDRVSSLGFSGTLITSSSSVAGNASAERNFEQKTLLSALLIRRGELDLDFDETVFAPVSVRPRHRAGFVVRV